MPFSYAQAIKQEKKKPSPTPAAATTSSSTPNNTSATTNNAASPASNTNGVPNNPRVTGERIQPRVKPPPPPAGAWGKSPPAAATTTTRPPPAAASVVTPQQSRDAKQQPSTAPNNPSQRSSNHRVPVASSNTWGKVAQQSAAAAPKQILKRHHHPNNNKPNKSVAAQPPKQTKSKKPKPQLSNMSLGDLISSTPGDGGGAGGGKNKKQQQVNQPSPPKQTKKESALHVESTQEFPSLSTVLTSTKVPKQPARGGGAWDRSGSATSTVPAPQAAAAPNSVNKPETATKTANKPKQQQQQQQSPKKSKPKHKKKKDTASASTAAPPTSSLVSSFFQPRARDDGGEEHQLLRMVQDRTLYQKRGRQRIAPRKKKFSSLKKKVLQERLDKYRALHPEEFSDRQADETATTAAALSTALTASSTVNQATCSVCIYNFAQPEELEDDDEYQELVENLKEMGTKIGPVQFVHIPKVWTDDEEETILPVFVRFETPLHATTAHACWNDLVVGGESLKCILLKDPGTQTDEADWTGHILKMEKESHANANRNPELSIILENVLTEDDYEDQDCLDESMNDIQELMKSVGPLVAIRADNADNGEVIVSFQTEDNSADSAPSILQKICSLQLGGVFIKARIAQKETQSFEVVLRNILTEEDLEDEDCLEESMGDIKSLVEPSGVTTNDISAQGRDVLISFKEIATAKAAIASLNGTTFGGVQILAELAQGGEGSEKCIYLDNLLTDDDLEDQDCLEESLSDITALASKFGAVESVELLSIDGAPRVVKISYDGSSGDTQRAIQELDGTVIGGQIVKCTSIDPTKEFKVQQKEVDIGEKRSQEDSVDSSSSKKARTDDKEPLYSGDKIIPERFAEMKRVPKIPNSGQPREYAKVVNDERVKPLLSEMLSELIRLQKRALEDKNSKAKRRLVMGLREVARGIRAHKVKMVVMANNLDNYGVIDEKLQEIIDLAHSEDVPLFFEFTKRTLGKAIGKSIKIAVVGIQNAEGAHQQFKKLVSIAR